MNRAPALPIKVSSWSLVHLGSRTRTAALLNQEQIREGSDRNTSPAFRTSPLARRTQIARGSSAGFANRSHPQRKDTAIARRKILRVLLDPRHFRPA